MNSIYIVILFTSVLSIFNIEMKSDLASYIVYWLLAYVTSMPEWISFNKNVK